jgi:hypothetical protein
MCASSPITVSAILSADETQMKIGGRSLMKRFLIYVAVSLLTAGLGITLTMWPGYRNPVRRVVVSNVPIKISNDKDDVIEIVFRDLIQRYPSQPVYFLSFGETDPSEDFMRRFAGDPRIKKLSQAIRNANQVIDPESGLIGVHVQAGIYYPIDESNVEVWAAWEIVQPVGKDPGWTIWPMKYQLRRVNGKWVIASSKIIPPLA